MELRRRGLVLEVDRYTAMRDGRLLDLTASQFVVMEILMAARGEPVPLHVLRDALQQAVGESPPSLSEVITGLAETLGHPPLISGDGETYTLA